MIYAFDEYQLDTQRYELRRGDALCPLEHQGFNVLLYLVEHRDRVVAKHELLEQLWPNQIVGESALTQRLRAARRALGDNGREQRFIKTLHGRGYRFIAAVQERLPGGVSSAQEATVVEVAVASPRCPRCQHVTLPEAQFCNACGAPLAASCPSCGGANPPEAAFCHACGASLAPPSPVLIPAVDTASEPVVAAPSAPESERRHLTVLFCDLVESTPLVERLDPEDYRDVAQIYQAVCAEVIERYDGHIAQQLGDALLVYFGWPEAHEDDAQRAVYAGLEMLTALAGVNRRLKSPYDIELAMRVAAHTGLVVVGKMGGGRQEPLALGAAPNVAARLQALAQPNTVVISGATRALVQGYFEMRHLGAHTLRGVSHPIPVYEVRQASEAQHRFEVARRRGLTPFVGRRAEVALLSERWEQAREGMGQVVVINGEAGIGKSRLAQSLYESVAHEAHMPLECRCSPYHQHSPFYPLVDLLARTLALDPHESDKAKFNKLDAMLAPLRLPVDDAAPLIAALLSIPPGDAYEPLNLAPQQQRRRTLTVLSGMLMAWCEQQPVLLVMEDLHWIDPSTREFLDLLIDQAPTLPLFVILTCRPVFQSPWGQRTHVTSLMLNRLSQQQVEQMLERVVNGKALPPEVIHHIVARTDGVPLFVEELTQAVLESGILQETDGHYEQRASLSTLSIPTTLQASLLARLDRLGEAKGIAQWGAALGRQFSYALLQASSQREEDALQRDLKSLVDAELLYQRGVPPHATYQFKHALIQEAAYESLLRSTRQDYHQCIAQSLTANFPETVQTQPELVAYHYTEAGLHEPAIAYWRQAGDRALGQSAYHEGIAYLTKVLALIETLPDAMSYRQAELDIQLMLCSAFHITKGRVAPEVEHASLRARELCEQIGDAAMHIQVLLRLRRFYMNGGELRKALAYAEDLPRLAEQTQVPLDLFEADFGLGMVLVLMGELRDGQAYLAKSAALTERLELRGVDFKRGTGADIGLFCRSHDAHARWLLGYPDQAENGLTRSCSRPRNESILIRLQRTWIP